MPKITVIMPSLNVVRYIKRCLESVLCQTISDIEVLAVDAGSTDGTLEILEEFSSKDQRIRLLHSDKKSYGYQLNLGIAEATGEYVAVVETDDMIVPNMFETLYEKAVSTEADYVKGTAELLMEISDHIQLRMPVSNVFDDVALYGKVIVPRERPELFIKDVYLWTGIYRREFIKQITLNETPGAAYQDAGFMFQAYTQAMRAVYLPDVFYLYRQDNVGASSYDKRAFGYFVNEYNFMQKFLPGLSAGWYEMYYQRMYNHCQRRFQVMGVSGEFWWEALSDMEELRFRLQSAIQNGTLKEQGLDEERRENLVAFLKSPEALYERYVVKYHPKTENIHAMLRVVDNHQKAVIFGSGKCGKFLHALMGYKAPGKVICYCDNQTELWGTMVQGIPVISPEQAAKLYPDAVYLIAGIKYETEMRNQLNHFNIDAAYQFTYTAGAGDLLLFLL